MIKNIFKIFIFSYLLINSFTNVIADTQSIAHLKSVGNGNENFEQNTEVKLVFTDKGKNQLDGYSKIIQKIIDEEKKFSDYYVLYHGCSNLSYTIQDVITNFYKLKNKSKKLPEDFQCFLRIPNIPRYGQFKNIGEFLNEQINTKTQISDYLGDVANYLLSTNLALFGNLGKDLKTESTMAIFLKNKGAMTILDWQSTIIKDILQQFGLDSSKKNIDKIFNLSKIIPDKGAIVQIFIPKTEINKFSYLARNYGRPYGSAEATKRLFDRDDKPNRLPNFWKLLETNSKAALGDCKETIENILKLYVDLPATKPNLKEFNTLQARILISNNLLLDPTSGVKIFRYNGYDNESQTDKDMFDAYKRQLKKVMDEICVGC